MIVKTLKNLRKDVRGATAIEYGLIAALLVIGIMVALRGFSTSANAMFDKVSSTVQNAGSSS